MNLCRLFVLPLALAAITACDAGEGGETTEEIECMPAANACDPLAAHETSITIDHVLAVGEAADGQLFVLAEDPEHAEELVFVSSGNSLEHKVLNVVRYKDGGTTDITFETCEGVAFVHFNNSLTGEDGVDWSGSYLHLGGLDGEDIEVTRLGSDAYEQNGEEYFCL